MSEKMKDFFPLREFLSVRVVMKSREIFVILLFGKF